MVKRNVPICDVCNVTIAEYKCVICGQDICKNHCYTLRISMLYGYIPFRLEQRTPDDMSKNCFCSKCKDRLSNDLVQIPEEERSIVFEEYTTFLKKIFSLVNI